MKRQSIYLFSGLLAVMFSMQSSAYSLTPASDTKAAFNPDTTTMGIKETTQAPLLLAGKNKTTVKIKEKTKVVDEDGNVTKTKVKIKGKTTSTDTTSSSDDTSENSDQGSSSSGGSGASYEF
jgi:uncharacterized membrane protein YgcG